MHQARPTLQQSDATPPGSDRIARRGRAGIGTALAAIALLAGGAGCASGGGSASAEAGADVAAAPAGGQTCSYGCMVPGPRVANVLSISPTDTLPEINPRTTLRPPLANAIAQEIEQNGWNRGRCYRKFGGGNVYVVLFHRNCDPGPDPGPGMVVGFSGTGQVLGRVNWIGPTTIASLTPDRR